MAVPPLVTESRLPDHADMSRDELIDCCAQGSDDVRAALAGLAADELDRRLAPGEWSPREIVHHLGDSETNSYIRLRRLLAEDGPPSWAMPRPVG